MGFFSIRKKAENSHRGLLCSTRLLNPKAHNGSHRKSRKEEGSWRLSSQEEDTSKEGGTKEGSTKEESCGSEEGQGKNHQSKGQEGSKEMSNFPNSHVIVHLISCFYL